MVHHARRRPRQDRPRAPGRARRRPRVLRAPGGDPPRGRCADGPGRRRASASSPSPSWSRAASGRRHARRPLLHPARLPPRRSRRPVRSASPRPASLPGSLAQEFAGPTAAGPTARIVDRASGRPHPDRARAGAARCRGAGPARLARAHRPPAVRGLGVRSRSATSPHQGDHDARDGAPFSLRQRRALVAIGAGLSPVAAACRRPIPTGRSAWSCPMPPAAGPTRSRA